MTTIPDTMRIISKDVQNTFEELVKLLLRKTLRPNLNPLGKNNKIVYNSLKKKYERGYITSLSDDIINKYSYVMTNESLGWTDDVLANLKVIAKFIKNSTHPSMTNGKNVSCCTKARSHSNAPSSNVVSRPKILFSDKIRPNVIPEHTSLTQYKNLLNFMSSRSMQSVLINKNASHTYTSDIPYTFTFKQLQSIGQDIIDQTDPSICGEDSAKMSTSMLRVKLYNLEQNLADLSVDHPHIYDAYVEMLRIINSVPKTKIIWIINLIAMLSFQRWEDLSNTQQRTFLDSLGSTFVHTLIANELITILLQSSDSELILSCSYLYPLLKMLFNVFGYSKLTPIITDMCNTTRDKNICDIRFAKHFEKYRGAYFRRQPRSTYDSSDMTPTMPTMPTMPELPNYDNDGNDVNCKPDPEPVDHCIYEFIQMFGDLYPTIVGLMGGTEEFPPESIEIGYNDIPSNYNNLSSIPEFLWRYNDYSYCRYLEHIVSKQLKKSLCTKINAKTKYLLSI